MVPGKPGGEQDEPLPYYFQIKQIPNGYELLSASKTPDSTCNGQSHARELAPSEWDSTSWRTVPSHTACPPSLNTKSPDRHRSRGIVLT